MPELDKTLLLSIMKTSYYKKKLLLILCAFHINAFAFGFSENNFYNSNNWATEVLEYIPNNAYPGYTNALVALGPAATSTADSESPGGTKAVTVIYPAWQKDQLVSIGSGGKLTVKMARQIDDFDDPIHPFGVDLLVFGNAFFAYIYDEGLPTTNAWYAIAEEPAEIWVSADYTNWFMVTNCFADSIFPTQSINLNGNPAIYFLPPNPDLLTNDWIDGSWSYTNTVAAYGGSAGGAPIDLSRLKTKSNLPTNLLFINYVKIENHTVGTSTEIDAIAAVADLPEPFTFYYLFIIILLLSKKGKHYEKFYSFQ